jgi:hypothetical protein
VIVAVPLETVASAHGVHTEPSQISTRPPKVIEVPAMVKVAGLARVPVASWLVTEKVIWKAAMAPGTDERLGAVTDTWTGPAKSPAGVATVTCWLL